jgi:uncharacterized membrane protein HdeD (DUF308 family)
MGHTQPQPALPTASGNWGAMVLRGIAAVLFGLAALLWPGMTLLVLLVIFALYALVDGLFAIVAGIRDTGGAGGCSWPKASSACWQVSWCCSGRVRRRWCWCT